MRVKEVAKSILRGIMLSTLIMSTTVNAFAGNMAVNEDELIAYGYSAENPAKPDSMLCVHFQKQKIKIGILKKQFCI